MSTRPRSPTTRQSDRTIRQEAREQLELVELNDQQLDLVAGGRTSGGTISAGWNVKHNISAA
jgi:hypothetical protein